MPQALISLDEHENRIVNVIKGKYGFRNKSDAITFIISQYEEKIMEPELRPEFVEKMLKIQKEEPIKIKNFREHFGLK